ncbi:hypothetical protein I4U23_000017 [Adineta vaga]|nr:hypothetical protein I4U23_000017 [Adineta vaga]
MQWCDNIFDVIDDNEDILEYTPEELNRYYMSGQLRSNFEEDNDNNNEEITSDIDTVLFADHTDDNQSATITNADKKIENKATHKEEDILSEKLSQLSTDNNYEQPIAKSNRKRRRSTYRSLNLVSKKIKFTQNNDTKDKSTNDNVKEEKSDDVPAYLSLTNISFLHVIQQIQNTENSIDMKDLQIIALLMHRITANRIQKQINSVYLRSGTGKLDDSSFDLIEIDRRVWPKEVKSDMLAKIAQSNITTATKINSDSEQLDFENLVNERLQQINEKIEQYTQQLIDKKNHLIGFTSSIEKTIIQYVQRYGIIPLQMKRDLKIALLKHDYNTIILRRKYEQENPNEYHLCTTKYELEKSKRELIELKQRVFYHKLPAFVKDIELSPPSYTLHGLNQKQIQLLSRGPTYVPPCQSRLKFSSKSTETTITDIVKKQYAPLKHQMASLFSKHRVNIALSWDVHSIICQKFTNLFAISIPHNIQQRATEEMKLIQSIRSSLKTNNMIIRRTADNRNRFYVGNKIDFEAKANEFMSKSSDKYEFTVTIGNDQGNNDDQEKQPQNPQYFLKGRIEAINFALETLGKRKALDNDTINKLIIDPEKVKLPYLYFLPDISKENELTLVPTIVAHQKQSNYHSFRRQWFDFFELQNQRSEKLQQLDDKKQVIRFNYFYDYGPRCEFNQYFHELWSDYFKSNPTLSNEKLKILLTTKHTQSLNALLSFQT